MSARALGPTELKRLHRQWRRRTDGRVSLILDGVMTPYNVGSIVRLGAAYGVSRLWLAGATPAVSHPGAAKTALGTDRYVDVVEGVTAAEAAAAAHDEGYRVIGVELADGAVALHSLDLGDEVCLAVGHEDHGLSGACLAACDALAYVPMVGRVGSLNVATAVGIALYEVRRQEWTRPAPGDGDRPRQATGDPSDVEPRP